jgi:membrane-associated phospholipid phosphatase
MSQIGKQLQDKPRKGAGEIDFARAGGRRANRGLVDLVAKLVTDIFSPPWVALALLAAVSAHLAPGIRPFFEWWLLSTFFVSMLPLGVIAVALWRRRISDWHVTRAAERALPFVACLVSSATGAAVLVLIETPFEIVAIVLGATAGVLIGLVLTPRFKFSIHTASIAGTVVIATFVFGPWALLLATLVPVIGWARIRVTHHTPAQVVVGVFVGAAVAGLAFGTITALP